VFGEVRLALSLLFRKALVDAGLLLRNTCIASCPRLRHELVFSADEPMMIHGQGTEECDREARVEQGRPDLGGLDAFLDRAKPDLHVRLMGRKSCFEDGDCYDVCGLDRDVDSFGNRLRDLGPELALSTRLSIAVASIGMIVVLGGFQWPCYCGFFGWHRFIASAFLQICSFSQRCA
jgi:hypothetical protein